MCPVCITTAVIIASGAASARELAKAAQKKSEEKHIGNNHPTSNPCREEQYDIRPK